MSVRPAWSLSQTSTIPLSLVRYPAGDFAVRGGPCTCGRPSPTLERVRGRQHDFIVTPDGTQFHGEYRICLFEDIHEQDVPVRQFQVCQTSETDLLISIVVNDGRSSEAKNSIANMCERRLSGRSVTVRAVADIPRAASCTLQSIRIVGLRREIQGAMQPGSR